MGVLVSKYYWQKYVYLVVDALNANVSIIDISMPLYHMT